MELLGYPRKNGSKGIRNYLVIVSTVACGNSVVLRTAANIGAVPITHESGCMDPTEKINRSRLIIKRIIEHPNVGAAVIVGLGCENIDAEELTNELKETGKTIRWMRIHDIGGTTDCIKEATRLAEELKAELDKQEKVPMHPSELQFAVQCGGSDWTSALAGNTSIGHAVDRLIENGGKVLYGRIEGLPGSEGILAKRAVTPEVGQQIIEMVNRLRAEFYEKNGQYIEDINPTPGNKAGGITTLLEKAVGNIKKAGSSQVSGIIHFGDKLPGPGLWFLDAKIPGPDMFGLSAYAIHQCHLTLFSTGVGNPIGNAIMPAIKLTGNSETYSKQLENFDFNASRIMDGEPIEKVGEELYQLALEVANGKATKAEEFGFQEFAFPY